MKRILLLGFAALLTTSCAGVRESSGIIASTGTILGIEGSQSPASDTPQATIGYKRAEFTFVPATQIGEVSKAESCGRDANGNNVCVSDDVPIYTTPNVLTEVYFKTLLQSSLYQRMAVGETAVQQGGAALIFAKGPNGELSEDSAEAISAAQAVTSTSYGCEDSCRRINRWVNDVEDNFIPSNVAALETCMSDNGLSTGTGRVGLFILQGKFKPIRDICVEELEIP